MEGKKIQFKVLPYEENGCLYKPFNGEILDGIIIKQDFNNLLIIKHIINYDNKDYDAYLTFEEIEVVSEDNKNFDHLRI